MSKIKVKQESLFPELIKQRREGVCCICHRAISRGIIGGGCYRKIQANIKYHRNQISRCMELLNGQN